jgi:hypothetical protein
MRRGTHVTADDTTPSVNVPGARMYSDYFQMDDPQPTRKQRAIAVPWNLVSAFATRPEARQIATSLYLDPPAKRAAIVLWPGVDPRWVRSLIAKLGGKRHK